MSPSPTDDQLRRIIASLNSDYGLGLRAPDPLLSPSKRHQLRRTEEEGLVDEIYHRIHVLHFRRGKKLSRCMGKFHAQSRRLLETPASRYLSGAKGVPRPSAADRVSLQRCLLRILRDPSRQPKRSSDESSDSKAKRPKSRGIDTPHQDDVLDSLPVRSRTSPTDSPAAKSGNSGQSILSYFKPSSGTARPSASLPTSVSFVPKVFSSSESAGTASGRTTPDSFSEDLYPVGTQEGLALHEAFSEYDTSTKAGVQADPALPAPGAPETLEERLNRRIWPKFPGPGLNEAPLAVVWEITRIAQHCGVEATDCDLQYEPNYLWREQSKLRAKLADHGPFLGKNFPPDSDQQAWAAALDTFQFNGKAVMLVAELEYRQTNAGPLYGLRLCPLGLEFSHRLQRRFGADRFLEIIIPSPVVAKEKPAVVTEDQDASEKIVRWLTQRPHYFLGRRWASFFIRDTKKTSKGRTTYQKRVHLFACDGNNFRIPRTPGALPPPNEATTPGIRTKLKLDDLLEWAIRLHHNLTQPIPKLFSRIALSLSQTRPTVVLQRHQILHRAKDIGTCKVMNDGAGRMSLSLAKKIAKCLALRRTPCCYQGRIGSAKGMWLIDVCDAGLEEDDWIETYPSQEKWACDFEDVHHRTFEVKNWPRLEELKSASLNRQFIAILEAQCIDRAALREWLGKLLVDSVNADIDSQMAAMNHPDDLRLWVKENGQSKATNVAQGYVPYLGGLPRYEEDTIALMIDSGFDQRCQAYLSDLSWNMGRRKMEQLKTKLNIKVPCSTYVYMLPDFTSTLEEGEVHVCFSLFETEEVDYTQLENMDILVGRAPAHLPSDIQKVRAVSKPLLDKALRNVIVFSTKGESSLADMLSGGDYDGDLAWICWDAQIVDNFRSVAVPQCIDLKKSGYLDRLENVEDESAMIRDICAKFVYTAFCFNMRENLLGMVTKYKETFCYRKDTENGTSNAIASDEGVIMSNLAGLLVDQSKQGILFTRSDWDRLRVEKIKGPKFFDEADSIRRRGEPHIVDYLGFQAKGVVDKALEACEKSRSSGIQRYDEGLTKMYNSFEGIEAWSELLKQLCVDIGVVAKIWGEKIHQGKEGERDYVSKVREIYQMWLDIRPAAKLGSSERLLLMQDWSSSPASSPWALLKASAAFKLWNKRQVPFNFVWRMAGRQLCELKGKTISMEGTAAPVTVVPEIYLTLVPDKKIVKGLRAQRGEAESMAIVERAIELDDYGEAMDV